MRINSLLSSAPRSVLETGIVAAAVALVMLGACDDSITPPRLPPPPQSDPVVSEALAMQTSAPVLSTRAKLSFSAAATSVPAERFVYVSLPTGAYPSGTTAVIRNTSVGAGLAQPMIDGGFDPIAIAAGFGDTLEITIKAGASVVATIKRPVPRSRRPGVVRTNPPKGKRDVALNSRITIIFSEPIDPATVTPSVTLARGGVPVDGTISVLPGGLAVEFVPLVPMARNTIHRLLVSNAARDLEGEELDAPVSIEFTTGISIAESVNAVDVQPSNATLEVGDVAGDSVQLAVTLMTAQGPVFDREVIWSTSDAAIAVVSSGGLVTARSEGVAIITATSEGHADSADITVNPIPVTSVVIRPANASVAAGGTTFLGASVSDRNGQALTRRVVTWATEHAEVAAVDQRGLVTGVDTGHANIIATSEGVSDTVTVEVGMPVLLDRVDIDPPSAVTTIGSAVQLTARLYRCNKALAVCAVTAAPIAWSSDNPAVATVDSTGRLTARGVGTASLTAVIENIERSAAVTVLSADPLSFVSVSAGYYFTCGLTGAGKAYCWGQNPYGELGIGVHASLPERQPAAVAPVAVMGNVTFTSISVGGWHVCGLTETHDTYCWGLSNLGQTGDVASPGTERCDLSTTLVVRCVTAPTRIPGVPSFRAVSAGGLLTCALTLDDTAYCWGGDRYGQLGNGGGVTANGSPPAPVSGGLRFARLTAGWRHACGLTHDGKAYCWGYNFSGQLGDGTTLNRDVPTEVAGNARFASLVAFAGHTCGITTTDESYCWGDNYYGQLGDSSRTSSNTPVLVRGGPFMSLAPGEARTCGLMVGGAVYCWGANGTEDNWSTHTGPVLVSGELTFASVSSGAVHACGMTVAEVVYCWGSNRAGQIGDGTIANRGTPVRVVGQ